MLCSFTVAPCPFLPTSHPQPLKQIQQVDEELELAVLDRRYDLGLMSEAIRAKQLGAAGADAVRGAVDVCAGELGGDQWGGGAGWQCSGMLTGVSAGVQKAKVCLVNPVHRRQEGVTIA